MEEKLQPTLWERTTTHRFLTWLFSARTLRRGLIALGWIVSLIALFYGVFNWWSRHAWNEYRQQYEARVAPLDWKAYIPKPIPDSDNFAATPFARAWFTHNNDTNFLLNSDTYGRAADMISNRAKPPHGRHYEKQPEDLVAWQKAFAVVASHEPKPRDGFRTDQLDLASRAQAAPAVLDGLKNDAEAFDELRAASARPDARYPVVYNLDHPWTIFVPHLAKIKGTCLRLKLKACAELALGQNEIALDDIKLMLYLADTLKTEPFLISYLVRNACVQIAVQPIWEGLAEHRWNDAQLAQLQGRLVPYDFLSDLQGSLHAERGEGLVVVNFLKKKGLSAAADFAGESVSATHGWEDAALAMLELIAPSGWYDQEKLHYCQNFDAGYHGSVDIESKRAFPSQVAANAIKSEPLAAEAGKWPAFFRREMVAALMLPALTRLPCKAASMQTATDQAAVACALERYRLANGQFPDSLQALVPSFIAHLPNDVITGDSFKYRRTDDGRFVLYSVGWNEKDDGGIPGKNMFDTSEGDWVW